MISQQRIFDVDDFVELEYVQNQRLNTSITITNLTDQLISFNIRINSPKLYPVVKPAVGIIYGNDKHKITISRLPLSKEQYELSRENPNIAIKDLFQVVCTLEYTDAIGKVQSKEQSKNVPVKIKRRSSITPPMGIVTPQKETTMNVPQQPQVNPLVNEYNRLAGVNASLQKNINSLQERISLIETMPASTLTVFGRSQIILLAVIAGLIGLCFVV